MRVSGGRWFAELGLPFDRATADAVASLAARAERLTGWEAAVAVTQDPRTLVAWDEERAEESALKARAAGGRGPEALHLALTPVVDAGIVPFFEAAERATRGAGLADPYLVRVMAGAVSQAAYRAALARAAGADDHPFVQKYALFERGRWILGTIAGTLYIY